MSHEFLNQIEGSPSNSQLLILHLVHILFRTEFIRHVVWFSLGILIARFLEILEKKIKSKMVKRKRLQ